MEYIIIVYFELSPFPGIVSSWRGTVWPTQQVMMFMFTITGKEIQSKVYYDYAHLNDTMTPNWFSLHQSYYTPNLAIFSGADGHSSLRCHRGFLWCSSHYRFGQYCSATPKSRPRVWKEWETPFQNSIGMNSESSIPQTFLKDKRYIHEHMGYHLLMVILWYLLSSFMNFCLQAVYSWIMSFEAAISIPSSLPCRNAWGSKLADRS